MWRQGVWMAAVIGLAFSGRAWAAWMYDFEPATSAPASGYTHVDETTAYSSASGYGFINTTGLYSRSCSGGGSLLRDFVALQEGPEDNGFRVDLPNRTYTVSVVGGDYNYATYQAYRLSGDGGATWTLIGRDGSTDGIDGITTGKPRPYTYRYDGLAATWPRVGDSWPDVFKVTANQYIQGKDVPITVSVGYLLIDNRFNNTSGASTLNFVEITPEPATLALLGLGLVFARRWKR